MALKIKWLFTITLCISLFAIPHLSSHAVEDYEMKCDCCLQDYPVLSPQNNMEQNEPALEVQEALAFLELYQGELTGVYDQKTIQAVKEFQKEMGLYQDGIVKYHVWLKLTQAADLKYAAKQKKLKPPPGEVSIVIDTFKRKLTVFNDNLPYAQFPIAIGKSHTPSPIGNWVVKNKAVNWGTGFGTRWMGLNVPWGVYGIHGTNKPWSIGSMASHGCFRMWNKDVETIYPWIKKGTPVTVIGNPFGYMSGGLQRLVVGDRNSSVAFVQELLWRKGFYQSKPDGLYGPGTERAVKALQKYYNLPQTGQVGIKEYQILGIIK